MNIPETGNLHIFSIYSYTRGVRLFCAEGGEFLEGHMVSKCANPGCAATFLYFHKGKLFRVETPVEHSLQETGYDNGTKKPVRRLEFFWLCDDCACKMTLAFERGVGIAVRPKSARRAAAA